MNEIIASGSIVTYADGFDRITDEMKSLHKAKNHDYGNSFSKLYERLGMPYALGHMYEKLERVESLNRKDAEVKNESIEDSLIDLACYAVMTLTEFRKKTK